jgi:integrase
MYLAVGISKQELLPVVASYVSRQAQDFKPPHKYIALVEVALAKAARRGELLAAQWADLDWATRTLTISKSPEQTKAGLRVRRPKNEKMRSFGLSQSDLIFCETDGSHYEPDLVSQVIIGRMRKAGIKKGSLHTLRQTHVSILLSRGVPLPAVSARFGHCDTNVTARIYSHALPADDQRAADVWITSSMGWFSRFSACACARLTRLRSCWRACL